MFRGRNSRGDLARRDTRRSESKSLDALKLVLECQRDLVEKNLSPEAVREIIELAEHESAAETPNSQRFFSRRSLGLRRARQNILGFRHRPTALATSVATRYRS